MIAGAKGNISENEGGKCEKKGEIRSLKNCKSCRGKNPPKSQKKMQTHGGKCILGFFLA